MAEEHRDTVLEILSDARVASPLIQTGLYHSKVNPRSYMYVFGHNSKAGEFANVSKYVLVLFALTFCVCLGVQKCLFILFSVDLCLYVSYDLIKI